MKQWAWRVALVALLVSGCGPDTDDVSYRPEALSKFQVGRIDEAKPLLQQALSRYPRDPFALYYMGRIASVRQEWIDAIYYYQCCIDADPSYQDARIRLAQAEKRAGYVGTKLRFIP